MSLMLFYAQYLKLFLIFIFIYLAVPRLSCGMWNRQSLLQHMRSLVGTCELLLVACGI